MGTALESSVKYIRPVWVACSNRLDTQTHLSHSKFNYKERIKLTLMSSSEVLMEIFG